MSEHQHELDATGLNCPLPMLRAKKTIASMGSGEVVKITGTAPGAVRDFEAFCKQSGNELLSSAESNGESESQVRKPQAYFARATNHQQGEIP